MIILIKPVDDGPLDINLKAGDVVFAKLDSDPAPGNQEKKSYLVLSMPDPVNAVGNPFPLSVLQGVQADMQREEFAPGATPEANDIRRARRYAIPHFRQRLSNDEFLIVKDANAMLPDGPTAFGGTVLSGVVSGLFTFADIVRK